MISTRHGHQGFDAGALRINPRYSVEHVEKRLKRKNEVDKDLFISALRKAGLN